MEANKTTIQKPNTNLTKTFNFDKSYWSNGNKQNVNYASQETIFKDVGYDLLDHSFMGYNTCIFTYGQTGSGKSYTMLGYKKDKGLIPYICEDLFRRTEENKNTTDITNTIEVSYMEIYCEKVRDLLNPKINNEQGLKVREHPSFGPYVEDLTKLLVSSYEQVLNLINEGNKARTVASTNMNETSSRSHAVFSIILTQINKKMQNKRKISRISLVDLAGSERANSTGTTGVRLKEGANINKSLTTLGMVISSLAETATNASTNKKQKFIPYRDSILTWLLKDSLGGNSKTAMIATISPTDYEETLSTLKYAERAKKIVNKAVINEDPNTKIIRELKEEIDKLKNKLGENGSSLQKTKVDIQEQIKVSEKLVYELNETREEKLEKAKKIQKEREEALEALGITIEKNEVGIFSPKKAPHLVNLNEDPLMSECLVYTIKPGITYVGVNFDESPLATKQFIKLTGSNVLRKHCYFENTNSIVTLFPIQGAITLVNGRVVYEPKKLSSGYRIIVGDNHVFRFNNPEEARREKSVLIRGNNMSEDYSAVTEMSNSFQIYDQHSRSSTPFCTMLTDIDNESRISNSTDILDWSYAWKEVAIPRNELSNNRENSNNFANSYQFMEERAHSEMGLRTTSLNCEETFKNNKENREEPRYSGETLKVSFDRIKSNNMHLLNDGQAEILKCCLKKLEQNNTLTLAECLLKNASKLKEANIISKRLSQNTSYQFSILYDKSAVGCYSFWEPEDPKDSIIGETITDDTTICDSKLPLVTVDVYDYNSCRVYTWSVDKFNRRLDQIRKAYHLFCNNTQTYHFHFNRQDMFIDRESLKFIYIGYCPLYIFNILHQQKTVFEIPVISQYSTTTSKQIMELTIECKNANTEPPLLNHCSLGDKFIVRIGIKSLKGIDHLHFEAINVQFKVSSLGIHLPAQLDPVHSTDMIHCVKNQIEFDYETTIELAIDKFFLDVVYRNFIKIEVFGIPTIKYLEEKENNEYLKEHLSMHSIDAEYFGHQYELNAEKPLERVNEKELSNIEQHDVFVKVKINELDSNGEYVACPYFASNEPHNYYQGIFALQQGVQRRICIEMMHNSVMQLSINNKIKKVFVGNIKLVDYKDKRFPKVVHNKGNKPSFVEISVQNNEPLDIESKKWCEKIKFEVPWDTSLHNSDVLNTKTAKHHLISLEIKWTITGELFEEVEFKKEINMTINTRANSSNSSLLPTLSKKPKSTANQQKMLYKLILEPVNMYNRMNLWRLNTNNIHIDGEETLLDYWKPRGISLVLEYKRNNLLKDKILLLQKNNPDLNTTSEINEPMIVNISRLKTKYLNPIRNMFDYYKRQKEVPRIEKREDRSHKKTMSGRINLVDTPSQFNVTKSGYLKIAIEQTKWEKVLVVIKRPIVYVYNTNNDEELVVFSLNNNNSIVDYNSQFELLIGCSYVFSVYTCNNSYIFMAQSYREMRDWIKTFDPKYNTTT